VTAGRADRCRLCRRFHRTADCPDLAAAGTPPPGVPAQRAAKLTRTTWPPQSTPPHPAAPALTEVTHAEEIVGPRGGPILLLTLACGHRLWRTGHRAPPKRTACVACWLEDHAHGEKGLQ
jgi:hypothetical protein